VRAAATERSKVQSPAVKKVRTADHRCARKTTGGVDMSRFQQCDASQRPGRPVLSRGGSDTSVRPIYMQTAQGTTASGDHATAG
jgi:hypothetical protein